MKIHNITLCNFKNFRDECVIDLMPNSKDTQKNMILIGGVNGSGKTTILESIKLCMFGKRFNGSTLSDTSYENYIVSAKNKSSVRIKDKRFFIQMEIEIDDSFPTYSITLKREWKINDKKIEREDFTIFRDGVPLEIIPQEYWEDYIMSLIPSYISNYFFFDGEKVKELSIGNNADEILRESIRDLTGLKLYEALSTDLESLISKIKRRNIDHSELQEKMKEKEKEISMIDKRLNRIKIDVNTKSNEVAKLCDQRKNVENDLRRRAGAFAKERKKNENALLKLKEELDELNNEIREICGEVLPFIIASNVCKDLLKQLKKERLLKELIASKHILNEVNRNFMRKMGTSKKFDKFSKMQLNFIKTEINDIFSEMFEELDTDHRKLIHDLTNAEMDKIENFLNKTEKSMKARFNDLLELREKSLLHSKKLKDKLKYVPDESFVKEYVEELASIRTKSKMLEKDINSLKNERYSLKEEKLKIEEDIKRLEEKIVCAEEDYRKIGICIKIRDSIKEFIDTVISSKIEELEKIITNMYHKIANKDDMIKEIKINSQTLTTTLIDFEEGFVDKKDISAGEKEIYALSLLWGLSKISKRNLPLIVDSLLTRLDNSHVEKIVKNFFPNAAEQVIILAHDREIDERLYKNLKPHINKVYRLSLNEENKINKGYFFE